MDLSTLNTIVQIARNGSLAGAARALERDPSVISRALSAAEAELGFRLFNRSTRSLSPTDAGARYLDRIGPALDELSAAKDAARNAVGTPGGTVRLSSSVAFGTLCIVPHLRALRARYPMLQVELILSDSMLDLTAERIDLAIRLAPAVSGDVIRARLMPTCYRVVASPDYLARHPLDTPDALPTHAACVFTLPGYRSAWQFRDRAGRVSTQPVTPGLVASNALALRAAVLDGLGPALLADWTVAADLAAGRLVDVFPAFDVTATRFDTAAWFVYPSRAFLPAKTRILMAFLRRCLNRLRPLHDRDRADPTPSRPAAAGSGTARPLAPVGTAG